MFSFSFDYNFSNPEKLFLLTDLVILIKQLVKNYPDDGPQKNAKQKIIHIFERIDKRELYSLITTVKITVRIDEDIVGEISGA